MRLPPNFKIMTDYHVKKVIAAVGGFLVSRGVGAGAGPLQEAIQMGTGTISDVKRRGLIDNANSNYMSNIMKRDRGDGYDIGEHVGFQARDMGNGVVQRSPLYEVDFGIGGKYHITAFLDERSGTFTHHLHRAEESELDARYDSLGKRQISYDDVRWLVLPLRSHLHYIHSLMNPIFTNANV